jgi:hypothetical protein
MQKEGKHFVKVANGTINIFYDNLFRTVLPISIASFPDEIVELRKWDDYNASRVSTFAQWLENLQKHMANNEHNYEFVQRSTITSLSRDLVK